MKTSHLFKNSAVYVFGDIVNKSIPFLLLPILTRYLSPADYSYVALYTVTVSVLSVFIGLSVHGVLNVNFFKYNKNDLRIFIGNIIFVLNITTLLCVVVILLSGSLITSRIHISKEWLILAVFIAFAQFLTTLNLTIWVAEQEPKKYTIYQLIQSLVSALASIVLVVLLKMSWEGQFIAVAIGAISYGIVSFLFILKRGYISFNIKKQYIKEILNFGIPLIPHSLSVWVRTSFDRIVLISMVGATATGIYTGGYQIAQALSVLTNAFNKAWSPYMFGILAKNPDLNDKRRIVKYTYVYFFLILLVALLFSYVMRMAMPFFLGKKFVDAVNFIYYQTIAFAFQGMYFMVTNYIFYEKKTHFLAFITFSTSLFHIYLLYKFVGIYGAVGAAKANCISYGITFLLTWVLSMFVYKMPWLIFARDNKE